MSSFLQGKKVLAISGGVGGAKLVAGLAAVLPPEQLTIVVNTADDFTHLGLTICPDIDSNLYALAAINNEQTGWGVADETWSFFNQLKIFEPDAWFQLGDKDLATHVLRSHWLAEGYSLTEATKMLGTKLGIQHRVVPMTDNKVATIVKTEQGDLAFQDYFVKQQCQPKVTGFYFSGIEQATLQQSIVELLHDENLGAIIICPSNPFVSVDPFLSLPLVRELLIKATAPIIAVSPIIGKQAVKGPAAKMLSELNVSVSATSVAQHYNKLLDGFIIDSDDAEQTQSIVDKGMQVLSTATRMTNKHTKKALAESVLHFAETITHRD